MQKKRPTVASANILRYFWLFIVLLVITIGLFSYNYVNAYLAEKKYALINISAQLQKRIDSYRFATYQIYENLVGQPLPRGETEVWENRLRPDAYYLEKSRRKTDAIIFGNHDSSSLDMALKVSDYLDTLWGAEYEPYSFYYLNGQDNSLTMISTQSIKELISRYKDSYLSASIEQRRTEMLQQANMLDERESFSPLRRFRTPNSYYFTLQTTFNQPGHLATVIAFDLPINDLIPKNMPRSNFLLELDSPAIGENAITLEDSGSASVSFSHLWLEISAPLANAPLKLTYRIPLSSLALDLLRNNAWLAFTNLLLLILSLAGIYFIRHQYIRPNESMAEQLHVQQLLNREIVSNLPLGLLVYNFANGSVVVSNKLAEMLLPHLSLQNIRQLAEQHQGAIQATINNTVYEIRVMPSQLSDKTHLFLLRDQDKDMMVNRKLQQVQREYEKNQRARRLMLHNLGNELNQPLAQIYQQAQQLQVEHGDAQQLQLLTQLQLQSDAALRLIDNITLLTQLETQEWHPTQRSFSPARLIDDLLLAHIPQLKEKGLLLFNHCPLPLAQTYLGDEETLGRILDLLLRYAIISTDYGKITCHTREDPDHPGRLTIIIMDTGRGLNEHEVDNLHYPFFSQAQSDRFYSGSGLTFFLCDQLCKKLNGKLSIQSKAEIGTRYSMQIQLMPQQEDHEGEDRGEDEKLLDGVTALLDISADEVRDIVRGQLAAYGANCLYADRCQINQQYDVRLTDDLDRMTDYSLLLSPDVMGSQVLQPCRLRVNYNLQSALIDAVLTIIAQRLSDVPALSATTLTSDELCQYGQQLKASDYFTLFANTVPEDVKRLYTEAGSRDFTSLSQTAHRLKGVFAMLNLLPGKQLCETLEQQIAEGDEFKIDNNISQIDFFVSRLLQQGSQQHE